MCTTGLFGVCVCLCVCVCVCAPIVRLYLCIYVDLRPLPLTGLWECWTGVTGTTHHPLLLVQHSNEYQILLSVRRAHRQRIQQRCPLMKSYIDEKRCGYPCMDMNTHTHTQSTIHTQTHTHTQSTIHTQTHTHANTHTHTTTEPEKHAHMHTHPHKGLMQVWWINRSQNPTPVAINSRTFKSGKTNRKFPLKGRSGCCEQTQRALCERWGPSRDTPLNLPLELQGTGPCSGLLASGCV